MFKVQPLDDLHRGEIYKRVGHVAVAYKQFVLVWGGFEGLRVLDSETYCRTDTIWMYNCITEVWTSALTSGSVPAPNSGSTGLILDNYFYVYGGVEPWTDEYCRYSNSIVRLNLQTLEWEDLQTKGIEPLSCDKGVGWVYKNKLYFHGGYGEKPTQKSYKNSFIADETRVSLRGWNNQLVCYDPVENTWSGVETKGPSPHPRAAHACDICGDNVYIYGGRLKTVRNNDLYILDMKSMKWSSNLNLNLKGSVPHGISWHSFNIIEPNVFVVYGGLNQNGYPTKSWWTVKISGDSVEWEERSMLDPLVWHQAVFCEETKEIIIIGGVSESPYTMQNSDHLSHQLILQFQPQSLFRECLKSIVCGSAVPKYKREFLPSLLCSVLENRLLQGHEMKTRVYI